MPWAKRLGIGVASQRDHIVGLKVVDNSNNNMDGSPSNIR